MERNDIHEINKKYWDTNADEWIGITSLPAYGVKFVTENELHLFGDVSGKKILDIGCGSGHSLKYHGDNGADELWGIDLSSKQIELASEYLKESGFSPTLINAPMEIDSGVPIGYFDFVYSIYAIGWTTDLSETFVRIASYLKKNGVFIFSWKHPLHHCVAVDNEILTFQKNYFNEKWFTQMIDGFETSMCNRKISTYINALADAGFVIEKMIEETDSQTMDAIYDLDERTRKAKMLPLSFIFKARKL